jgi:hypothetical protein
MLNKFNINDYFKNDYILIIVINHFILIQKSSSNEKTVIIDDYVFISGLLFGIFD